MWNHTFQKSHWGLSSQDLRRAPGNPGSSGNGCYAGHNRLHRFRHHPARVLHHLADIQLTVVTLVAVDPLAGELAGLDFSREILRVSI